MFRRKIILLTLVALFLSLTLIRIAPPAMGLANIYVYPKVATAEQGEDVTIDIKISGAVDVFGWELKLRWNSTVLNYISVTEGNLLKGIEQNPTNFITQVYQDQEGNDSIVLACTRLGYITGVDGSGTMASVTFEAEVDKGETLLDLYDTKLVDSRPTPYPIEHTSTDGLFSNIAGFPIAEFSHTPQVAVIDETIVFNASASFDADGTVESYFWDFGDDSNYTATDPYASHAYSEGGPDNGAYVVTLTVTDNEGWNGTTTQDMKVRFLRDVAVTSIALSQGSATIGDSVTITVTALNDGSETVSFGVTAYYSATSGDTTLKEVGAQSVSNLAMAQNKTLTFNWNTGDVAEGTYRVRAVAESLSGEIKTLDNAKWGSEIRLDAPPPFPWTAVIGGVAIGALVCIGAFFYIRRRRQGGIKPPV
jgi:PKD repeat protein